MFIRRVRQKAVQGMIGTHFMRSDVVVNGRLQAFANALRGDGIQVGSGKDRVHDAHIVVSGFTRD